MFKAQELAQHNKKFKNKAQELSVLVGYEELNIQFCDIDSFWRKLLNFYFILSRGQKH